MRRIGGSIDGAATVGRAPNGRSALSGGDWATVDGETRFADVAPILPLSSIRDAPPNCKRFAEIFLRKPVPKTRRSGNGRRTERRTVALGRRLRRA